MEVAEPRRSEGALPVAAETPLPVSVRRAVNAAASVLPAPLQVLVA